MQDASREKRKFGSTEWEAMKILGVRIDLVDYDKTLRIIHGCILNRLIGHFICVTPVHPIMECRKDSVLRNALEKSLLTVPDGMPVVWAAKLLGGKINDRVYGPNLMLHSCGMAEKEGYSVFLYGSKPETLEKLKTTLVNRFPRLKIAGTYSPPFHKLNTHEEREIIQMINAASPDILFVGLGVPKQEKWMLVFCHRIEVPISLGVGAAFDFISGEKKQAPSWMQKRGLEWFFRLMSEPMRLWKRYLIYNPLFIFLLLKELLGNTFKSRKEIKFG